MTSPLALTAGSMRLDIAPALGGAILGWHDGETPLLRESFARTAAPFSVRDCAAFPLIPFSNRIARGQFAFGGQTYRLPKDVRDPRHAMHGNALYAPWQVTSRREDAVELALAYRAGGAMAPYFPFSYDASQTYRLGRDALTIELSITSRDARPFPAGLGHHLYFACEPDTVLAFQAETCWRNDQDGLPAIPDGGGMAAFAAGYVIGATPLDNCFSGWDGKASIRRPAHGFRLDISATQALRHAVLFTPPGQNFFAFEPVSHLSDAVNRMSGTQLHGLVVLGPGETFSASISIVKRAA